MAVKLIMKHISTLLIIAISTFVISCQRQKDQSKTIEEYYGLGFPNIEKDWTPKDFDTALNAIENLKQMDQFALPKMNSNKSAAYFNKMIRELPKVDLNDFDNINSQFETFGRFEKLISRLAFAYGPQEELQIYYSNEAIELNKMSIVEIVKVGKLFQILISNMSDSIRVKNKANEDLFEGGVVKVFEASLETHLAHNKYAPEDKIELARVISSNLPVAWPWLSNHSKSSIFHQIVNLSQQNEIAEIRKIYLELTSRLRHVQ